MKSHDGATVEAGGLLVQMAQSMSGLEFSYAPGDIVTVTEAVRRAWIEAGIAIDASDPVEDASANNNAERATVRRRAR